MANYRGDSYERDSGSSRRHGSSSSSSNDSSRRDRDRRSDWSRHDDDYRGSSRHESYGSERGYGYPPIVYDDDRPAYGTQSGWSGRHYYGESALALTPEQAAGMAAALPAPGVDNPRTDSARWRQRRDIVLRRLERVAWLRQKLLDLQ